MGPLSTGFLAVYPYQSSFVALSSHAPFFAFLRHAALCISWPVNPSAICDVLLHAAKKLWSGQERQRGKRAKGGPPGRCQKLGLFPDHRCSCLCRRVIGWVFQAPASVLVQRRPVQAKCRLFYSSLPSRLQRIRPCRVAQVSGAAKVRTSGTVRLP
jgi:hypothetical protein